MSYCTILSKGDKIKLLRKKYKLRQEDIAGNDITRNLISEIETNKANLTRSTAEAILKNLQKLGTKNHFEIEETVDYLLEDETIQASRVLDDYVGKLKTFMVYRDGDFTATLKEVEEFLVKWSITDKKIIIYELAGDYFGTQNEMDKSIIYYEKALTLVGKLSLSPMLLSILKKLSKVYGCSGKYNESIECCDFALNHFENLSQHDTIYFVYNRAYVFFMLKNYERALADIEMIENLLDANDMRTYFTVLDTKAVCLHELKKHNEAIKLYNRLLEMLDDKQIDKRIVIRINIAEVYIELSNVDRANYLLDEVKKELPFINNGSGYEANIYYEIGKIYRGFNDKTKSSEYYSKALKIAKKQNDYVLVNNILYELMDGEDSIEKVDNIKNEAFIISAKQEKLADKLVHKLIGFYANNNSISKLKEINDFALQFV